MIDVSPLRKAIATLDVGLSALAAAPDDDIIRDACLQRFKYCYELSHKMLRRYLEATEPANTDQLSFPAMIRLGFERGLLTGSWDVWNEFRAARNNAAYAYDEVKANAVLVILPPFAAEAKFLCAEIGRRHAVPA